VHTFILLSVQVMAVMLVALVIATVLLLGDRRRRLSPTESCDPAPVVKAPDITPVADHLQHWLDQEWERRYGRGISGASGSIEG
jgi:hypothetical protein